MKIRYLMLLSVLAGCKVQSEAEEITQAEEQPMVMEEESKGPIPDFTDSLLIQVSENLGVPAEEFTKEDLLKMADLAIDNEEIDIPLALQTMKNLDTFTIHTIQKKNIDFWEHLSHIETLSLSQIGLEDLRGAEALIETGNLFLGSNHILDITPLKDLPNLKYLDLHDNRITSLEPLEGHSDLNSLALDRNPIKDFSTISKLNNLTYLSLNDTPLDSLEFARGMKSLNRIQIADTQVSDLSPLENLKELTYLDIRKTNVTSIQPLFKLDKLKILLLDKDNVMDWKLLKDKEGLMISETVIMAE